MLPRPCPCLKLPANCTPPDTCRGGWQAAFAAAVASSPACSPAQAAALAKEADAAFKRCQKVVPPTWVDSMRKSRESGSLWQPAIQAHLGRSPGRWQKAIKEEHRHAFEAKSQKIMEEPVDPSTCDGCGQRSVTLKKCSGCKQRRYVSVGGP